MRTHTNKSSQRVRKQNKKEAQSIKGKDNQIESTTTTTTDVGLVVDNQATNLMCHQLVN